MTSLPLHGQQQCETQGCKNWGYFAVPVVGMNVSYMYEIACGVHSRGRKQDRLPLHRNRQLKKRKIQSAYNEHEESVRLSREKNFAANKMGCVMVSKTSKCGRPVLTPGYLPVWTCIHHRKRQGWICPLVDPANINVSEQDECVWNDSKGQFFNAGEGNCSDGCSQKLDKAMSVKVNHDYAKCVDNEHDDETGWPKQIFWTTKFMAYRRRHEMQKRGNHIHYWCRSDNRGKWHKFSEVEERYFFCKMYEQGVKSVSDFKKLEREMKQGTNLQIMAGSQTLQANAESLYQAFKDPSASFGYGLALAALLACPQDLPWDRYRRAHPDVYEGFSI